MATKKRTLHKPDPNPALTRTLIGLCRSFEKQPGKAGKYARCLGTLIQRESGRIARELHPRAA